MAAFDRKIPLKLQVNRNNHKTEQLSSDEYTIPKHAKIEPCKINFEFNTSLDDHLKTVEEALEDEV